MTTTVAMRGVLAGLVGLGLGACGDDGNPGGGTPTGGAGSGGAAGSFAAAGGVGGAAGSLAAGAAGSASFVAPKNAAQIGGTELYLLYGKPGTAPAPTSGGTAPVVLGATVEQTGPTSFSLFVSVVSRSSDLLLYLDFGPLGVYVVVPVIVEGGGTPMDRCDRQLAEHGNPKFHVPCHQTCVDACVCLACPDSKQEQDRQTGCMLNCTITQPETERTADDAAEWASFWYRDFDKPPAECSQAKCSAAAPAASAKPKRTLEVNFATPSVPDVTPLVAIQAATDDTVPQASTSFAAAGLSLCKQGEAIPCRP